MSKNKENSKERFGPLEGSEWTPPLKGDALKTFRQVEEILLKSGRSKHLGNLKNRLEKAGKKRAETELENFIRENELHLEERRVEVETREIVDSATRAGSEGVDRVVQAGGDQGEIKEASAAAEELVRHTLLLAKDAGPDGSFVAAADKASSKKGEGGDGREDKQISLRLHSCERFNEIIRGVYEKWTEIPSEKLDAAGLTRMKAEASKILDELSDIDIAMSPDEVLEKRIALSDLSSAMNLRTKELLEDREEGKDAKQKEPEPTSQVAKQEKVYSYEECLEVMDKMENTLHELDMLMFDRVNRKRVYAKEYEDYLTETFQPLESRGVEISRQLRNLQYEIDRATVDKKLAELMPRAEEWMKEAASVKEYLEKDPFIRPELEPRERKERVKKTMAWLKEKGEGLSRRMKDLKIEAGIRAIGERYNKIPRKYKYAASAILFAGGLSAGAVGGSVGAAALGLIGAGRFGYRLVGSAALFVSLESGLQARKEKKETRLNRHPKAVAAGVAALIAIGVPGMIFKEIGGAVMEHASAAGHAPSPEVSAPVNHPAPEGRVFTDTALEKFPAQDAHPALEQIQPISTESAVSGVEWGGGETIIEVHQGDNLWNILKQQLQEKGLTDGMTEQQKNYVISSIENKLRDASREELAAIGFSSGDIDVINPGEKLNLSGVLDNKDALQNILERAGHAGQAAAPEGMAVAEGSAAPGNAVSEAHDVGKRPISEVFEQRKAAGRGTSEIFEQRKAVGGDMSKVFEQRVGAGHAAVDSVSAEAPVTGNAVVESGVAENAAVETAVAKDPTVRLWEMAHPGETAPKSVLEKSMELRAHGVPLENDPLFAEQSLSRMETNLKEIFGPIGSKSEEWSAWKDYPVEDVINAPRSSFDNLAVPKLQDYVRELVEKTGLRPEVRGGRMETLGHFIIRAEAGSLSMDLGGGAEIDLKYAPGLYEETGSKYVPQEELPEHLVRESVTELPPRYDARYYGFHDNTYDQRVYGSRAPTYYRPAYRSWPEARTYGERRWWWPFQRRRW